MPDVVKYGISNFTCIGGFPSLSSHSTLGSPKCARIKYSLPPGNDLIVQVIAFCSGAYFTLPMVVLNLGESASAGTGITISTLLAVDLRLNCDFALILCKQNRLRNIEKSTITNIRNKLIEPIQTCIRRVNVHDVQ